MRETLRYRTRKDRSLRGNFPLVLARIVHWALQKHLVVEKQLNVRSSCSEVSIVSIVLETALEELLYLCIRGIRCPSEFGNIRVPILVFSPNNTKLLISLKPLGASFRMSKAWGPVGVVLTLICNLCQKFLEHQSINAWKLIITVITFSLMSKD